MKKAFNIEEYQAYLATLDRGQLIQELYTVKRPKDPLKHQLIEDAFKAKIQQQTNKEAVQKWVNTLPGTTIVLRGYKDPIKIVSAQMNGPATAAIVTLEDKTTKYLRYKGENNA